MVGSDSPRIRRLGWTPQVKPHCPASLHLVEDIRFVGVVDNDGLVFSGTREIGEVQFVQFAVGIEAEVFILSGNRDTV
jgi:hypothetical protein